MSVFFRSKAKPAAPVRSNVQLPSYLMGGSTSYADINVSVGETALQSVAVRAAVDLIASLGSELPIGVFSGSGADMRGHPVPGYLQDPAGDGNGLADWAYQVLSSWLLRGNLYGDILAESGAGYVTQLVLHHPDCVGVWVDPQDGVVHWYVNGRPVTDLTKFVHRRVNPIPGAVLGLSPVQQHAAQIGLTLTTTAFGLQWFKDGAHPSGMFVNEESDIEEAQAKTIKARFMAAVHGTREPLVTGRGWKYQSIQVSPEESQFLATQGYTEAQCARIFGPGIAEILGYESGGSLTYTNVESRMSHLLTCSLDKWFIRLERLLSAMLPGPQFVRIDRDALLSATTLDRYKSHELALRNRWKTVNDVRATEGLGPVEWGDEPNLTYVGESTAITVDDTDDPKEIEK